MPGELDVPDGLWDLESLRRAPRLCGWMYEQFDDFVGGEVVEVGPGIGTFSARLLAHPGVTRLVLIEPAQACVEALTESFGDDARVTVVRERLPDSAALVARAGKADFVLCQNVLEHIEQDRAAVRAMADALRPGGRLTLLVPANPCLYGKLDRLLGHHRRYTAERLSRVIGEAGLAIDELYAFNLLGVLGWWVNGLRRSPRIGRASLRTYEALLRIWQPIERRRRPPFGLSLVAHAHKPAAAG
jgi:SAM-dependent methyltransferase